MKDKLLLKTDKHFLYVINRKTKKFVRFNLKSRELERRYIKKSGWYAVEHQYDFFRGFNIEDLEGINPKFKKLLELSRKYNDNCSSLSTFIVRLAQCLVYENFIVEDVNFKPKSNYWGYNSYTHLKHPLQDYDKVTIKFLKQSRFEVKVDFEKHFFDDKEFFQRITGILYNSEFSPVKKKEIFRAVVSTNDVFRDLVNTYKYDVKALLNFVVEYLKPFENVSYDDAIVLLRDYYKMAFDIGRKVKKYPKYLKSMHDIIKANYESYEREYNEKLFSEKQKPELEFENKKSGFCVIIPKNSKDIVSEGTQLNHCVASYVDKILEGKTLIIFMRRIDSKEDSLVTLEYKDNKIVTAKGSYNRNLVKEESEFLKAYCSVKKIELCI